LAAGEEDEGFGGADYYGEADEEQDLSGFGWLVVMVWGLDRVGDRM